MNIRAPLSAALCVGLLSLSQGLPLRAQSARDAATVPSQSAQDAANDLSVTAGKSALVDFTSPVTRVAVGLGDIAEVTAVSRNEVMVNGKAPGNTTLIVWQQDGKRTFFNVTVHASHAAAEDSLVAVRRELKIALPEQNISAVADNNLIFLRGTVNDLPSSDRAVQIASGAGKVVNLLYVKVPEPPRQILLKVRFASVDRTLTKQLGINLFSTGAANTIGTVSTGQYSAPTVSQPSAGTGAVATISNALNMYFFRPDLNLGATIEALEAKGVVQVLAEPNLLAEDGKQASFLAGGEYPYPVVQGGAGTVPTVTIQFKEFGVRLTFIPTITPRGTIRLQVAPEVSSLDFSQAITISGFSVPAIDTRRVKTEVELNSDQSFAIGGLLDNRITDTLNKIPFIGDIPVLGKLFQSINKTRSNTELIVIITPELVSPVPAGQSIPVPNYPLKFLPPNSTTPMHTPDAPASAEAAQGTSPASVPVEELIKSNQPEKPLVVEGGYGSSSTGSTGGSSMTQQQ